MMNDRTGQPPGETVEEVLADLRGSEPFTISQERARLLSLGERHRQFMLLVEHGRAGEEVTRHMVREVGEMLAEVIGLMQAQQLALERKSHV
jgi:hypothetical protein